MSSKIVVDILKFLQSGNDCAVNIKMSNVCTQLNATVKVLSVIHLYHLFSSVK